MLLFPLRHEYEVNCWNVLDTDGVYGLVPQRVIDDEDEKLRAWKQDADLVNVDSFMCDLSLLLLDI